MSDSKAPATKAEICRNHAALVAATQETIDALPMLPPDAAPHSFAALKAASTGENR